MRRFNGIAMVEGKETGDGRFIKADALTWGDLPLPLKWVRADLFGHEGAVVVGTIDSMTRSGTNIDITGATFDPVPDTELARGIPELEQLIEAGVVGLSAELDDVTSEIVQADTGEPATEDDLWDPEAELRQDVTEGRVRAVAVVSTPAFIECTIAFDGDAEGEPEDAEPEAVAASACCASCASGGSCADDPAVGVPALVRAEAQRHVDWRANGRPGGTAFQQLRAGQLARGESVSHDDMHLALAYFARHEADREMPGWNPTDPGYPSAARVAWAAWGGDPGREWARHTVARREGLSTNALRIGNGRPLVAAAPVDLPPAAWFRNPHLTEPTSLTVADDGRVVGHLATWGTCHIGIVGECVKAPPSATAYAYFHQGRVAVRTDDGKRMMIACGKLTAGTGHADMHARRGPAVAHYDDTGWCAADVVAGEDEHGIWLAGALRPGCTAEQREVIERAAVSGDWRYVDGLGLELVAALGVNTPGFPIVKSRVAGGQPMALIAGAGMVELARARAHHPTRRHDPRLEPAVLAVLRSVRRDPPTLASKLRDRVLGGR
jgi:hypothetical protein